MISFRLGIAVLMAVFAVQGASGQAPTPSSPAAPVLALKSWESLSYKKLLEYGQKALGPDPHVWLHAETEHFVYHFHDQSDLEKIGPLAEAYYRQVQLDLGAGPDRLIRKNHVFVFSDDETWKLFARSIRLDDWAMGVSSRTELFIYSPKGTGFAVGTLGHEITHCIFYRFVPKPVPLWLNEGFAEFEKGHAYARFKGLDDSQVVNWGGGVRFPLKQLLSATKYPKEGVEPFYVVSERLVRFLLTTQDRKKFLTLVQMVADGAKSEDALLFIYHDQFKSFAALADAFEKFDPAAPGRKQP